MNKKIKSTNNITNKSREVFLYPLSSEASFYSDSEDFKEFDINQIFGLNIISQAINMIASDIAKVKFRHYQIEPSTKQKTELNSKIINILNGNSVEDINDSKLKRIIVWNLFLYGQAFLLKELDEKGEINNLIPLLPTAVTLKQDKETGIRYYVIKSSDSNKETSFKINQIIQINYELIQGFGVVKFYTFHKSTLAKLNINETILINALTRNLKAIELTNKPENVLSSKPKVENASGFKWMMKKFRSKDSEPTNTNQNLNTSNDLKINDTIVDKKQLNKIAIEVAAIFGIPPQKLGIEVTTNKTPMEINLSYSDLALFPLLTKITQKLTNELLPKNQSIEFTRRDLLSIYPETVHEIATSLMNSGVITPNEMRELLGLEKIAHGDKLIYNSELKTMNTMIEKDKLELETLKTKNDLLKKQPEPDDLKNTSE